MQASCPQRTMGMKWVHALAAVLTVMLFLARQRCALAGVCRKKSSIVEFPLDTCGDTRMTPEGHPPEECSVCARALYFGDNCPRPKYKRDPDISIDNEAIGQHPYD